MNRNMALRGAKMSRLPQPACPDGPLGERNISRAVPPALEQVDERGLLRAAAHGRRQPAGEVTLEHPRVDVALTADRGGVAQYLRRRFDGAPNVAATRCRRARWRQCRKRTRAEERAGPGAEILAGEIVAGDRAQIGIHVGGLDRARAAVIVDVMEQVLAGQLLHAPYDAREPRIGERYFMRHAALAAELEP